MHQPSCIQYPIFTPLARSRLASGQMAGVRTGQVRQIEREMTRVDGESAPVIECHDFGWSRGESDNAPVRDLPNPDGFTIDSREVCPELPTGVSLSILEPSTTAFFTMAGENKVRFHCKAMQTESANGR